MSGALSQLLEVKSRYAEACLAWLGAIDAMLSEQPLLDRFGRSLDDAGLRIALQVEPFDVSQFRDHAAQEKRERENLLPRGGNLDDERRIYAYRGRGAGDDRRDHRPKPEPLDPLLDSLEVGMILGDPGFGKSESLKDLAVRLAKEKHAAIQSHTLLSDDVCLPVFAELPTVAELFGPGAAIPGSLKTFAKRWLAVKLEEDDARLRAAILHAALRPLGLDNDAGLARCGIALRKIWYDWQAAPGKPRDSGAVILLDAWDEIAKRNRTDCFKNALHQFSQQPPVRLLATSRLVAFETGILQIPASTGPGAPRRELAVRPFRFEDCEAFIRAFFGQREHAEKLIADLRAKPMIMAMLQNPLLATLVCLAFDPDAPQPVPMPARRSAVYGAVVQRLLGDEEARRKGRAKLSQAVIRDIISMFRALAFDLWPEEVFDEDRLDDFCDSDRCPRIPALRKSLKGDETLSQFLRECGLLTSHGEGGLKFLHLTFQEYFVGGWLAAAVENGWSKAKIKVRYDDGEFRWIDVRAFVDRKAWHPRWREVIALFAGQIEQVPVEPLLETLMSGGDDIFHHRLCLAALCLAEAQKFGNSPRTTVAAIANRAWKCWIKRWDAKLADPKIGTYLTREDASIGSRGPLLPMLARQLNSKQGIQRACDQIAGIGGAAGVPVILNRLAALIRSPSSSKEMIGEALHAVEGIGPAAATPEVLCALADLLRRDSIESLNLIQVEGAVKSMGAAAGNPQFLRDLIEILRNTKEHFWIGGCIAQCLGNIGSAAVTPEVLGALLQTLRDPVASEKTRGHVPSVLYWMSTVVGTPDFLKGLGDILHNPELSDSIIGTAAEAVGRLAKVAATPEILSAFGSVLQNPKFSFETKSKVAHAVHEIGAAAGTPGIVEGLTDILGDPGAIYDAVSCAVYAVTVVEVGTKRSRIVEALQDLLSDPDVWLGLRTLAAFALAKLGEHISREQILELAVTMKNDPETAKEFIAECVEEYSYIGLTRELSEAAIDIVFREGVSEDVKRDAVLMMGWSPTTKVVEGWENMLRDLRLSEEIRSRVSFMLASSSEEVTTDELAKALTRVLISNVCDSTVPEGCESDFKRGLYYLAQRRDSDELIRVLTDMFCDRNGSDWTRACAAFALRGIEKDAVTPKILNSLLEILQNQIPNAPQMEDSLNLLASIGDRADRADIISALMGIIRSDLVMDKGRLKPVVTTLVSIFATKTDRLAQVLKGCPNTKEVHNILFGIPQYRWFEDGKQRLLPMAVDGLSVLTL